MESWFLADADALESFYGSGFRKQYLSGNPNVEQFPKQDVLNRLDRATRNTSKGRYRKGKHGFAILELLDPAKVKGASRFADRFLGALSV